MSHVQEEEGGVHSFWPGSGICLAEEAHLSNIRVNLLIKKGDLMKAVSDE